MTNTVQGLRVRTVRVPMQEPHRTASGTLTESPLVLTDAVTSSSAIGHSLFFTYTAAALGPTADLIRNIEPLITNEPLAPVEISDRLASRFRFAWVTSWLLCATQTSYWLEFADWWNPVLSERLQIDRGMAHPQTGAGSAIEWNAVGIGQVA